MLRGLTYLRYRRIVHGNIKASNVFRDPATGLGILGDFRLPGVQTFNELAKEISSNSAFRMSNLIAKLGDHRVFNDSLKIFEPGT